jgi:hypothetical protein
MDDDSDLTASDDDQSNDVDAVSTPVIEAVRPPQIKCNTKRVIMKKKSISASDIKGTEFMIVAPSRARHNMKRVTISDLEGIDDEEDALRRPKRIKKTACSVKLKKK